MSAVMEIHAPCIVGDEVADHAWEIVDRVVVKDIDGSQMTVTRIFCRHCEQADTDVAPYMPGDEIN